VKIFNNTFASLCHVGSKNQMCREFIYVDTRISKKEYAPVYKNSQQAINKKNAIFEL
jgi:hypothetical protein